MKQRSAHRVASALLWMGLMGLGACQRQQAPESGAPPSPSESGSARAVLLVAGDIASCDSDEDEATAAMLDALPGEIATLGDNVYPTGAADTFARCYAPSWGRHKARTHPAPGNHEYLVEGAAPYYDYFGAAAGERGRGYYSWTLGTWHLVALNSELRDEAMAEQVRWLREDLRTHPAFCTLAYMHRPLFTSFVGRDNSVVRPLWQALEEADADVVLAGHDHFYERYAPQTSAGEVDAEHGLREFVVGTGGKDLYTPGPPLEASEWRMTQQHGLLRLTLEKGAYGWEFLQLDGKVGDSGRDACH